MSANDQNYDFRAPVSLAMRKSYDGKKPIKENEYRNEFMRDRDRIMYCSSFRRLDGKTQIYRTGGNDHQRNRMTHTLEVAQLSRTIAVALKLDSDLVEAIALGHDLGHSPFGHAGEEVLHRIMMYSETHPIQKCPLETGKPNENSKAYTGFKHNIQSVRIITEIDNSYEKKTEDCYKNYGLDLTNFTLWGIMHHSAVDYTEEKDKDKDPQKCLYGNRYKSYMSHNENDDCEAWSFEAFVVKQADQIAQWHHDLEDALRGNAMTSAEVCNTVKAALGNRLEGENCAILDKLKKKKHIDKPYLTKFSHIVIDVLVNWLIECSKENLKNLERNRSDDEKGDQLFLKRKWTEGWIKNTIGFSVCTKGKAEGEVYKVNAGEEEELRTQFNDNIREKIHHSQPVERMNAKGKYIIEQLFKSYYSEPQQLPTSILIQYLLDLDIDNEAKISDILKKAKITKAVRVTEKPGAEYVEEIVDVTIEEIVSSWDKAWEAGTGAVRICFKKIWAEANDLQKILLMRKICDHIAGMTEAPQRILCKRFSTKSRISRFQCA